jgi:SagB-type dehydrogenase family enzyme
MPDTSISLAQHYHNRTKYDPQTISAKAKAIDFASQPVPFKSYPVGTEIDLKPYLDGSIAIEMPEAQDWMRLSRLFINAYGLTAKFPTVTGQTFYLRSTPSAGALYPAELYLVSRGTHLLPPGLYNYQARTHSLWRYWDAHYWSELQRACFWHPALESTQLALIVTAVFYRSVWRYQDRAYRRICLDAGHLLGNIEIAGMLTDYRPHLIASFADQAMTDLLYLDPDEEGVLAVLPLADLLAVEQNLPLTQAVFATPRQTDFLAVSDEQLVTYFHQATAIEATTNVPCWPSRQEITVETHQPLEDKYNFPFCLRVPTQTTPMAWDNQLSAVETTLLKRRSTRQYTGAAIPLEALKQLLDFTYQPHHYGNQDFDIAPDYCELNLLQTFLVVSEVEGLEAGCYYYAPHSEELRQVRFKQFRRELHYLCLGQELGRDAAVVLFHTADLKVATATYGDRVYRYLHMDAGHLGQRLNLAAVYLGLGVSGIGGFYDDQVNDVLGIPADEAVIYITTLGQPG